MELADLFEQKRENLRQGITETPAPTEGAAGKAHWPLLPSSVAESGVSPF